MAIITREELSEWVLRDAGDVVDTDNFDFAVAAANAAVVDHCGRSFDKTTNTNTARVFHPLNARTVHVDDFWTNTALVVKVDTTGDGTFDTTWSTSDYQLEPLNGLNAGQSWPYTRLRAVGTYRFPGRAVRPSVQITAQWGWAAVPDAVKQGALIFAGRVLKRKDSPLGTAGFDQFGVVRISRHMDPDAYELLAPYVRTARKAMVR